jgi:flagella basal body P-ring formation protein FlgA
MRIPLSLLMLSFVMADALADAATVQVALRAENTVAGAFFRLDEIAAVHSSDATLERELGALRIGLSPRAGSVLALKPGDVASAITRLKPELRDRVRVSGAQDAAVRRGPLQTVELARVRESAARALEAFLAERYRRYEIESLGEFGGAIVVPDGRLELRPRIAAGKGPVPAHLTVWIEVHISGVHYQSFPVMFAVRGYLPVFTAKSGLRRGDLVRTQELLVREEQVAGYGDTPVPVDVALSTLRVKRPLAAGEVLTWRDAEQPPAVSRNQEIHVRLAVGAITVETAAIATQDARPGEVIQVRASTGRQTYSARVTGLGAADVLWR